MNIGRPPPCDPRVAKVLGCDQASFRPRLYLSDGLPPVAGILSWVRQDLILIFRRFSSTWKIFVAIIRLDGCAKWQIAAPHKILWNSLCNSISCTYLHYGSIKETQNSYGTSSLGKKCLRVSNRALCNKHFSQPESGFKKLKGTNEEALYMCVQESSSSSFQNLELQLREVLRKQLYKLYNQT